MIKKLLRTVTPKDGSIFYCHLSTQQFPQSSAHRQKPSSFVENRRSAPLSRISMLWMIADIGLSSKIGVINENFFAILAKEISHVEFEIAINCGAVAIDAARLLTNNRMPFCDTRIRLSLKTLKEKESTVSSISFSNLEDLDSDVCRGIIRTFPTLATFSLMYLKKLHTNPFYEDKHQMISEWIKKLVPILLLCMYDCLGYLVKYKESIGLVFTATKDFDPHSTCQYVFYVLRVLISSNKASYLTSDDLIKVLEYLSETLLLPFLGINGDVFDKEKKVDHEIFDSSKNTHKLISQACSLMKEICGCTNLVKTDVKILMRVPLFVLITIEHETATFQRNNSMKQMILSSYIDSIRILLEHDTSSLNLQKDIFSFTLSQISKNELQNTQIMTKEQESLLLLLQHCSLSSFFNEIEALSYVQKAAKIGNWPVWEILQSQIEDRGGIICSLQFIKEALNDLNDTRRHMAALAAIQCTVTNDNECSILIMSGVGLEVLQLLKYYGENHFQGSITCDTRKLVCSESIKVIMISYQYLFSEASKCLTSYTDSENKLAAFLNVVFEVLVSIITYNGLPNQFSETKTNSDPNIGRICAQSFLHVAKLSPSIFKATLATLTVEDQNKVERAVRAEMSINVIPKKVASKKKKLLLKSFSTKI